MKAGPATPRGGGRALALRLLLWLGLAVALLAALALGVELLQPPPEAESSRDLSLGGFGGAARAALVGAALAQLLAAVPLLVGLRRRDARWAMLGLTLVGTLAAAVPVLFLVDARDPPSCPEGTLGGFAAPAWFVLLLFVATTAGSRAALGVERQAAARVLAVAVRVGLVAVAVVEAGALLVARHPARSAIDGLAVGLGRGELVRRLEPHCSISAHPGRLLAECRAVVPAPLRCAPAPAQRVTLELDGQERLLRWQRGWTVAGACGERQR